jgi:hypothetical protein
MSEKPEKNIKNEEKARERYISRMCGASSLNRMENTVRKLG